MSTAQTAATIANPDLAPTKLTLQQTNIQRVQALVREYQNGNPAGYMEGVHDEIKGSVLGGLIPGGEAFKSKAEFGNLMGSMEEYMEVKKFEPVNWRAVGDDVLFQVNWEFVWKATGKNVETTALVRKVVKDGLICEKYHMCDNEAVTGEKSPHDWSAVTRVQELLAHHMAGNPEGYLEGVSDGIVGSVMGGLIPGGDAIASKADFMALAGSMEEYMEVKKFAPREFRALPNDDMMFLVDWEFVWKPTGKNVETTALVRKVVKDGKICEKWHVCDVDEVLGTTPRDIIGA